MGFDIKASARAVADWLGAEERARFRAIANLLFVVGVIVWLVLELNAIGWAEIWASRPTAPAYYLLVLLAYINLPIADALIYRQFWREVPFAPLLAASLRKRIYNSALIGYSGDLFLFIWARSRVDRPNRDLLHQIKDSAILSAVVSNTATALLIVYLLFAGTFWEAAGTFFTVWAGVTVAIAALTPLGFVFRRRFMLISAGMALIVLGIHAARFAVGQAAMLGQWAVELSDVGLSAIISLWAVQLLVARIPIVPNRDLLFVSLAVAMTGSLDLPRAEVAGLLITTGALYQILHLLVLVATTFGGVAVKKRDADAMRRILEEDALE